MLLLCCAWHNYCLDNVWLLFGRFTERDTFIGYQDDTPASVVFQATQQLKDEKNGEVDEEMEKQDEWMDSVLQHSQSLLIQMATPDALIRLKNTPLADQQQQILKDYSNQCHESIAEFLSRHLRSHEKKSPEKKLVDGGLLLHVNKCPLLFD